MKNINIDSEESLISSNKYILIVGIVLSIILGCSISYMGGVYIALGIVLSICIFVFSLFISRLASVLVEISLTLKKIEYKNNQQ